MKSRILVLALVCASCLCAQKRFSWQDACFKNPRLPYCIGRDVAVKPTKGKTAGNANTSLAPDQTVDAAGVDWRFADPAAEAIAVLNCNKLLASPTGRGLIGQLAASQGLSAAGILTVLHSLSDVQQVALSLRQDRILILATGRAPDSVLPMPNPGWKATSVAGKAVLIGQSEALDEAARRLLISNPLSELAHMALERPPDSDFWAAGLPKLASQDAVAAGVKRFSLRASAQGQLAGEAAFEFDGPPDPTAIHGWLATLDEGKIDGDLVRAKTAKLAETPLLQRLAVITKYAHYLPVHDTATTRHTKPVIVGLDEGAREVK